MKFELSNEVTYYQNFIDVDYFYNSMEEFNLLIWCDDKYSDLILIE